MAGLVAGIVLTIVVARLVGWASPAAANGLEYGFGAGFGGVMAFVFLNKSIGLLDRIKSGKA